MSSALLTLCRLRLVEFHGDPDEWDTSRAVEQSLLEKIEHLAGSLRTANNRLEILTGVDASGLEDDESEQLTDAEPVGGYGYSVSDEDDPAVGIPDLDELSGVYGYDGTEEEEEIPDLHGWGADEYVVDSDEEAEYERDLELAALRALYAHDEGYEAEEWDDDALRALQGFQADDDEELNELVRAATERELEEYLYR